MSMKKDILVLYVKTQKSQVNLIKSAVKSFKPSVKLPLKPLLFGV